MNQLGQFYGKITLIFVLIYILFKLGIRDKRSLPLKLIFIIGWSLYVLPMELRPFFKGYNTILFCCGILPSFGCAFALPIFGLKSKSLTFIEAKHKIVVHSFYTFILISLYEFSELFIGFGTFDFLDLALAILGLITLNVVFRTFKTIFEPVFENEL